MIEETRLKLRAELEAPADARRVGTGWLSGVAGLVLAVVGLALVGCLRYPNQLAMPPLRPFYNSLGFRLGLHCLLVIAFASSAISLVLRANKVLGFAGIATVLLATVLGGSRAESHEELTGVGFLGLDWFVLNVIFTGLLFVPVERMFPRHRGQGLFRTEWREDLFYYFVSSLLVQVITFLSMTPANTILANTQWSSFRAAVANQWTIVQIVEVMFLTDLVQYWVHRSFHKFPMLWRFHAVHHSAQTMDWMAGARMHFLEILVLRGATVIPMVVLGFSETALHFYILLVYLHSTFIHANVGWMLERVGRVFVTPRFHHWHHGIEREAIDVNFAIHFPLFDRLFGTHYLPRGEWPSGYGIGGHPVPKSYWQQFLYPFRRERRGEAEVGGGHKGAGETKAPIV